MEKLTYIGCGAKVETVIEKEWRLVDDMIGDDILDCQIGAMTSGYAYDKIIVQT
jgi:hypothetical protein